MSESLINPNQIKAKHRYLLCGGYKGTSSSVASSNPQWVLDPSVLPWKTGNVPFVLEMTFRTPTLGNGARTTLFSGAISHFGAGMQLQFNFDNATGKFCVGGGLGTTGNSWDLFWVWSDYELEPYTFYQIRVSYDLTKYTFEYKQEDDSTWILLKSVDSTTQLMYVNNPNFPFIRLGVAAPSTSSFEMPLPANSAIDLNQLKIISGTTVYFDGLNSMDKFYQWSTHYYYYIQEFWEFK